MHALRLSVWRHWIEHCQYYYFVLQILREYCRGQLFVDALASFSIIRMLVLTMFSTTWSRIRSSLKRAMTHIPADPVVPRSGFDSYSSTPLPKKLGIKANSIVALISSPQEFEKTLGELPDGVTIRRGGKGPVRSRHLVHQITQGPGEPHRTDGDFRRQGWTLDRLAQESLRNRHRSVTDGGARAWSCRGSG